MNRWLYIIGGIFALVCTILLFVFAGPFYGFCFLLGIAVAVSSVLIFRTYGQLYTFYFLAGVFTFVCLLLFFWFMWSYILIFFAVLFTIAIFLFLGWIRTYQTEAEDGRPSRQPFKVMATVLIASLIGMIFTLWIVPIIQEKRSVIWPIYYLSKKHKHEAIDMESGNKNEPFALAARREMYILKRDLLEQQAEFIRNQKDKLLEKIKIDREKNPDHFPGLLDDEFKDLDLNLQRIAKQTDELNKLINLNGKSELTVEKENAEDTIHKAGRFLKQKADKLTDVQKIDIRNKILILGDSAGKNNVEDIKQDKEELLLALKLAGAPLKDTKENGVLNEAQKQISTGFSSILGLNAKTIFWIIIFLIIVGNFAGAAFKEAGPRYSSAIKSSVVMFALALLLYNFIWGDLGRNIQIPQIFLSGSTQNQWEIRAVELPEINVYKDITNFIPECYDYSFRNNTEGKYFVKDTEGKEFPSYKYMGLRKPEMVERISGKEVFFISIRKTQKKIEGCE